MPQLGPRRQAEEVKIGTLSRFYLQQAELRLFSMDVLVTREASSTAVIAVDALPQKIFVSGPTPSVAILSGFRIDLNLESWIPAPSTQSSPAARTQNPARYPRSHSIQQIPKRSQMSQIHLIKCQMKCLL